MMTTRTMLARAFEDIQEEKRQMKANYRQDIAEIEQRQERILDRMERLDKEDRDLVDVEGVMVSLADTAAKLSELIPDVPVQVLLEKTAEKMAELEPEIIMEEPKEKPIEKEYGIMPRPWHSKEIMEIVVEYLKERNEPVALREIEATLKNRYGWEWKTFSATFSNWRKEHPNMIDREGIKYTAVN